MKNIVIAFLIISSQYSFSQAIPPKQPYSINIKQIHSGHSLTDPLFNPWPGQYRYLMHNILKSPFDNVAKSTIPGSQMRYRWENPSLWGEPSAKGNIRDWQLLIITERVPLHIEGGSSQTWYLDIIKDQRNYLSFFANNAWTNGNQGKGTPTLLWTTWTNINNENGPWRPLLDIHEKEWEAMQDFANSKLPEGATPIYLIPGHRMMARLYDDIQKNIVPGITNINQFFSDNIHLNERGSYAAAMIHYACIFNKSPEGLTNQLSASANPNTPTPALALYLQKMIWEVVTTYPRTGIVQNTTSAKEFDNPNFYVYPNPASDIIQINNDVINPLVKIYQIEGKSIITQQSNQIDISSLQPGIYIIDVNGKKNKLIKL